VAAALLLGTLSLVTTVTAAKGRPDVRWTASGHSGGVTAVEFSPDGSLMATSSADKTAKLWSYPQGTLLRTLVVQDDVDTGVTDFSAVRFTPDGTHLAAAVNHYNSVTRRDFGQVHVFRVSDGALVSVFGRQEGGIASLDVSPDGLRVATGGSTRGAKIWRMSDGALVKALKDLPGAALAVRFSPNGDRLSAGYDDHRLALWRTSDGSLVWNTIAHDDEVMRTEFSPGGDLVASASRDGTAKLFNAVDGAPLNTLRVGMAQFALAFSLDGTSLATGGLDGAIRQWDVALGSLVRTFDHSGGDIESLRYSNDGQALVSGGGFSSWIKEWNPVDGAPLRTLSQFTSDVNRVVYSNDSRLMATATRFDYRVDVFDAKSGQRQYAWDTQAEATDVAISPNNKLVATPGRDNTVVIRRLSDGKAVRTLVGHKEKIFGLAFSHDGTLLASGSFFPGSIRLWRTTDWTLVREIKAGSELGAFGPFASFSFSADDTLLGTVAEGAPLVLRVSDGTKVAKPAGLSRTATFSPDGQRFVTSGGLGGSQDQVRIFRVSDWTELQSLQMPAHDVAFSSSGKCLLAAQSDGLRTWRTADWTPVLTYDQELGYAGSGGGVQSVAVAPDEARFAYARADATLVVAKNSRLWHQQCD
jgi:WD40 repeat protein